MGQRGGNKCSGEIIKRGDQNWEDRRIKQRGVRGPIMW